MTVLFYMQVYEHMSAFRLTFALLPSMKASVYALLH